MEEETVECEDEEGAEEGVLENGQVVLDGKPKGQQYKNLFREVSVQSIHGKIRRLTPSEYGLLDRKACELDKHRIRGAPPQLPREYLDRSRWDIAFIGNPSSIPKHLMGHNLSINPIFSLSHGWDFRNVSHCREFERLRVQFRPSVVLIEVDGAYWKCCISSKNNDLRDSTKELSTDLRHHPEFGDHLFYIGVFRRQYLEQRYAGCFAARRSEWWIGPFWGDIASLPRRRK